MAANIGPDSAAESRTCSPWPVVRMYRLPELSAADDKASCMVMKICWCLLSGKGVTSIANATWMQYDLDCSHDCSWR